MSSTADNAGGDRKFVAALLALAVGGFAIIGAAWYSAHQFGDRMAEQQAVRHAKTWSTKAVNSLVFGKDAFAQAYVTSDDRSRLYDLLQVTDIYRYSLLDLSGKIFWSSRLSQIGNQLGSDKTLAREMAKGNTVVKHDVMKASDIDSVSWHRLRGKVAADAPRQVIEVYVPFKGQNGSWGAVVTYTDVTDTTTWFSHMIDQGATLLCIALAVIFISVGALILSFGRDRRRHLVQVTAVRDEALRSEAEARELTQELQQVNERVITLNRDLADHMQKLQAAQDEIIRKGKMAQLGQLTATVAHEIRNPLGAVRTATYLIERKTMDKGLGIEAPLKRIANGISRCDGIITELLDFARSKALQLDDLSVDDWIAALVEDQAQHLPEAVALECHLGLGDTRAEFDNGRMQRTLINLLSNASEAMVGKGDIAPAQHIDNPRIVVTSRLSARGIDIAVSDNGPGISPENLKKIREPLFTTKSFGVGLGLPAVEKILEQHGGGLDIETAEGKGTTMTAWFPIQQTQKEVA